MIRDNLVLTNLTEQEIYAIQKRATFDALMEYEKKKKSEVTAMGTGSIPVKIDNTRPIPSYRPKLWETCL